MERIALGNHEFEGRNNVYLLAGEGEVALVDTGVATDETRAQLEEGLAEHGHGFDDVDVVVVTHWHYDHAGLVGEIQEASGAVVYAHADDAPIIGNAHGELEAMFEEQTARLDGWGMPSAKQEELRGVLTRSRAASGPTATVEPVEDGDRLEVAGTLLEVVHAPGHTAGHTYLVDESTGGREAFVGDVILPVYTPNVGGADVRVDRPLETYARTLESLADREFERVWPGHRDVIEDPGARAHTILQHHRDRTRRVLDALAEHGPADTWTVSDRLFGELEGIHVLHGPGEAWAHLDHLERHGLIERDGAGYRLVDEAAEPEVPELC